MQELAMTTQRHGALKGQTLIFMALAMPLLCGLLALAMDVGATTARYQMVQHTTDNAADAGAYALYGRRSGATTALTTTTATDNAVWTAITSNLTLAGFTVRSGLG